MSNIALVLYLGSTLVCRGFQSGDCGVGLTYSVLSSLESVCLGDWPGPGPKSCNQCQF